MALGFYRPSFRSHATLVTRANGVWQSVHAFVAEGDIDPTMGPIQRILELGFSDAPGMEVHVYLAVLAGMLWPITRHFADDSNQEWAPF